MKLIANWIITDRKYETELKARVEKTEKRKKQMH